MIPTPQGRGGAKWKPAFG